MPEGTSGQKLKVTPACFQAKATLKSEPIIQMIQNLTFDLQADSGSPRTRLVLSSAEDPSSPAFSPTPQRSMSSFSPSKAATPRDTPPSKELFIGGLPFDADEDSVLAIFEKFGSIAALDMSAYDFACLLFCSATLHLTHVGMILIAGNVSKGFAFLTYDSIEAAKQAVAEQPVRALVTGQ